MRWRLMLILVAAVVTVGGVFSYYGPSWHSNTSRSTRGPWPVHLSKSVELQKGEILRDVLYYPDGIHRRYAEADLSDGGVRKYWFGTAGKLQEAKTFSRLIDGERKLLRHALFEANGYDYVLDTEFYLDGVMKKLVQKMTDTVSFRWHYFETGELRLFENFERSSKNPANWFKRISDTYRKDGSLFEHINRKNEKDFDLYQFSPENRLVLTKFKREGGYRYFENYYFEDGVNIRRKLAQDSKKTEAWIYHPNNQVFEHRKWIGPTPTGTIYFDQFDSSGAQTLEQVWNFDTNIGGVYTPMWVVVFVDDKPCYRFWFANGTSRVIVAEHFLTEKAARGDMIRYDLHEDGTVKIESYRDGKDKVLVSENYTSEQKRMIPFKLDPAWFVLNIGELPPQVVEYDPNDT